MTAYGTGLPRELLEMQRIQNGVLNASLDILLHTPAGRITRGDLLRSILKQAHEVFAGTNQDGAFYARFEQGHYFLYPMEYWLENDRGGWGRHWYNCRIDWEGEFWIFEVMV